MVYLKTQNKWQPGFSYTTQATTTTDSNGYYSFNTTLDYRDYDFTIDISPETQVLTVTDINWFTNRLFIDTFSSLFGPIFGVMIADYYFIKSKTISNKDIYSAEVGSIYYFSNGWHIKGCYSIFIGFIFSASTIWNPNLIFLQSFAWIVGAFISFITYYLLAKK